MRRRGLRYCVRCWTCLPPTLLRNNPWSSEPKTGGLYENRSLYSSVLLYTWHILTIIHHIIWILYLTIVIQSHSLTSCWQTGSHSLSFQVLKITSCKSIEAGQPWWIMREPNYKPCFCIFLKKSIIGVCYWVYLTTWLFFFPGSMAWEISLWKTVPNVVFQVVGFALRYLYTGDVESCPAWHIGELGAHLVNGNFRILKWRYCTI